MHRPTISAFSVRSRRRLGPRQRLNMSATTRPPRARASAAALDVWLSVAHSDPRAVVQRSCCRPRLTAISSRQTPILSRSDWDRAPCAARAAISLLPRSIATTIAALPSTDVAFAAAPYVSSSWSIRRSPLSTACTTGGSEWILVGSGSARAARSALTISASPRWTAIVSGASPKSRGVRIRVSVERGFQLSHVALFDRLDNGVHADAGGQPRLGKRKQGDDHAKNSDVRTRRTSEFLAWSSPCLRLPSRGWPPASAWTPLSRRSNRATCDS